MSKKDEALKLALEKFANVKALCDKHGDKINRKHVYGSALVDYFDVVCQALTEQQAQPAQPAQQEPVDFASLLREAEEIVREKPTWKRFIDGTPLANDIAVWMTVFAQDVARRASPPASKPLTDEEILAANYPDGEENGPTIAAPDFELICFARQIEAKLREKNNG